MSFGTQGATSYRLGDHARAAGDNAPDGDHIAQVQSVELVASKDNKPQLKVVSHLLDMNNRQHTWYYTLTEKALWRFFQDLLALGADPNFNPGAPGPHYADIARSGMTQGALDINLHTKDDYQNTKIRGKHQNAPNNGSAFSLEGANQSGNQPEAVQPVATATSPWPSGGLPMGAAPGSTPFGGASPTAVVDAASLFKQG
jgi:hypothetical protein